MSISKRSARRILLRPYQSLETRVRKQGSRRCPSLDSTYRHPDCFIPTKINLQWRFHRNEILLCSSENISRIINELLDPVLDDFS